MNDRYRISVVRIVIIAICVLIMLYIVHLSGPGKRGLRNTLSSPASGEQSRPTSGRPPIGDASKDVLLRGALKIQDAPIEFFGKVTDQDGNPLGSVDVMFHVMRPGSIVPRLGLPGNEADLVVTGNDGRFKIGGRHGMSLGIDKIRKSGYHEPSVYVRSFGYGSNASPHNPDIDSPVIFVLIKDGRSVVVKSKSALNLTWDEQPQMLLLPGDGNGALMITAKRDRKPRQTGHFTWSLAVRLSEGVVREVPVGSPPSAEPHSYTESVEIKNVAADSKWLSSEDLWVDFKTSKGCFGRAKILVYSDRELGERSGMVETILNPSGGRGLE